MWDPGRGRASAARRVPAPRSRCASAARRPRPPGQPIDATVRVRATTTDLVVPFEQSLVSLGPAAAITIGNLDMVLATTRAQTFSPPVFTDLGVDLAAKKIVVVKSSNHFYAAFSKIAAADSLPRHGRSLPVGSHQGHLHQGPPPARPAGSASMAVSGRNARLPPLQARGAGGPRPRPRDEGAALRHRGLRLGDVGRQGWSMLAGDLPLPLAVIKRDVLAANSAWMSAFAAENGLLLAPHGKTTMAPQLFALQIADGAWAITVATVQQLEVCRRFGVRRVLMANQPIGRLAVDACFRALRETTGSSSTALPTASPAPRSSSRARQRHPPPPGRPLRVLVEIGFPGGRTGARTRDDALAVARAVAAAPGLALAGFECFEGLLPNAAAVDAFLDEVVAAAAAAENRRAPRRGRALDPERRRFGLLRPGRRAFRRRRSAGRCCACCDRAAI